jgi:hypothetical protein
MGLALGCENTTDAWFETILFSIKNRELMVKMSESSYKYLWGERSASLAAYEIIKDLQAIPNNDKFLPIHSRHESKVETNNKRVAVCLHLFYVENWDNINLYIKNINFEFELIITCPSEFFQKVESIVKLDYPYAKINAVENIGMDVWPFLEMNFKYSLWRFDAVLKIHSKNIKTQDGSIIGKLCMESLLGSRDLIDSVVDKLLNRLDVGIIGAELLFRSVKSLIYGNEEKLKRILNIFNISEDINECGFFAGTMFWIRGDLLKKLAFNHNEITSMLVQENSINVTGQDGTWAHSMERFFGILASSESKTTLVSYISKVDGLHANIRAVHPGELMRFIPFNNGSTAYLLRFHNLKPWYDICKKSVLFDDTYYSKQASFLFEEGVDPLLHYILYGDCFNFDPSIDFSTEFYKKNNPDVVKSRSPLLIHYILNGKREGRLSRKSDIFE